MSISVGGGNEDDLYQPLAEINVTPLVDVMLVLLIVFMVAAPLLSTGVKVNLPAANSAISLNPKAPLVVTVEKDGQVSLDAEQIGMDALVGAVHAKIGDDASRIVHVRGDKDAPFGRVVAVMDKLTLGGVSHIAIVTTGRPGASAPVGSP